MAAATQVGGAMVEVTMDLAKFADAAKTQLAQALGTPQVRDTVTAAMDKASSEVGTSGRMAGEQFAAGLTEGSASMADAGMKAGEAASTGTAEGITAGTAKVTEAAGVSAEEVGTETGLKFGEMGAKAGEKFSEGAKETMKGLASSLGPMVGALGAAEIVKSSIEAADQLEGANIKVENLFGESGDAVKKWAGTVSTSLRMSSLQAETTAGSFGGFLNGLGLGKEQSADMSMQLTSLTANMAAFNNADPASVQAALTGALKGRTTALKQYGVTLSTAQVNQEAMSHASELGTIAMKNGAPALTTQQKALATLYAVMDATKNQQGALAKTSDTLKAKEQVATAEFTNMRAELGAKLMPILAKMAGFFVTAVIPALQKAGTWIDQNRKWLIPLVVALGAGLVIYKATTAAIKLYGIAQSTMAGLQKLFTTSTEEATVAQEGENTAMEMNPIGLVVAALAALVVGLIYAYEHSKTFRDIVKAAFADVKTAARDVVGFFTKDIPDAFNSVVTFLRQWGPLILTVLVPFIGLPLLIIQHWGVIATFFEGLWNDVVGYFSTALTWLKQAGMDIINGLWAGIQFYWQIVQDFYVKMPEAVLGYIGDAASWLGQKGRDIISGLLSGLRIEWDTVTGWIKTLATDVKNGFATVWDGLSDTAKTAFNAVADLWNSTIGSLSFSIPSWVPGVGGKGFSMPKMPHMDTGGFTPGSLGQPSLAMVHGGEYMLSAAMLSGKQPIAPAVAAAVGGSGGGRPIEINQTIIQQPGQDPSSLAADVSRQTARSIRLAA